MALHWYVIVSAKFNHMEIDSFFDFNGDRIDTNAVPFLKSSFNRMREQIMSFFEWSCTDYLFFALAKKQMFYPADLAYPVILLLAS